MQFQADIINTTVQRAKIMETTALGAAYLAGLHEGVWSSLDEIRNVWDKSAEFTPSIDEEVKNKYIKNWHKAVKMCQGWEKE